MHEVELMTAGFKDDLATMDALDGNQQLLRFTTCGSVDDGKSTLLGRLLLDTGAIHDDQLAALRSDSRRHGTTEDVLDAALLLDGLEDERQQGITIDVAYRYFSTATRKFIIADSPGHEQYTRNMVTAASTADAAVILVDARKGILPQTKRHSYLVALLGVRHIILAVNKMDLVDFDERVFTGICDEYREFARQLRFGSLRFVPVSALRGDHVVRGSTRMAWHSAGSLLDMLEQTPELETSSVGEFRFAVQWVNRPHQNFRGFSGTVAAGMVRVGDEVVVMPSRRKSRVKSIVTLDGDWQEAWSSQAVTLTLEDDVDVTRGDVLVRPGELPSVTRDVEAMLVWMSEQPLVPGRLYWLKHAGKKTAAEVVAVRERTDVNTLCPIAASSLGLNEIGWCAVRTHEPLVCDPYRYHRETGSFILVDRITHETVAAGMIKESDGGSPLSAKGTEKVGKLEATPSRIPAGRRHDRFGSRPFTLLITGLSGSGKTTLAYELESRLFEMGRAVTVLDGQNLRLGISRDLGFSAGERSENLRRAAEIAKLMNEAGVIVIGAFVAPQADVLEQVREVVGADRLRIVHLAAPIDVCRQRDTSGRYEAADAGKILAFPGVSAPYECPRVSDVVLPSHELTPQACADRVLSAFMGHFCLARVESESGSM